VQHVRDEVQPVLDEFYGTLGGITEQDRSICQAVQIAGVSQHVPAEPQDDALRRGDLLQRGDEVLEPGDP